MKYSIIIILIIYLIQFNNAQPYLKEKYIWTFGEDGVTYSLTLVGTGFDSVASNNKVIFYEDTKAYAVTSPIPSTLYPGNFEITLDSSVTPFLSSPMILKVNSNGQDSNLQTYMVLPPIKIDLQVLHPKGGNATFTGTYPEYIISYSKLYINNTQYQIETMTTTSLSFIYPQLVPGIYEFWLSVANLDYKLNLTIAYPAPPSLIYKYTWEPESDVLVLFGKDLDNVNSVLINGKPSNATNAIESTIATGYYQIQLLDSSPTSIPIGEAFSVVVVDNDSHESNQENFNLIKSISINTTSLNPKGGNITFSGSYSVSNKSIVSLLIDNNNCLVNEITQSSISFNYPSGIEGQNYTLSINIGGFEFSKNVTYVTPEDTTTTTGNPTTSTTGYPSSEEKPSSSYRLLTSLLYILSTSLFLLLL